MPSPKNIFIAPLSLVHAVALIGGCEASNDSESSPSSGGSTGSQATGGSTTGTNTTSGGGDTGAGGGGGVDLGPPDVTADLLYIDQEVFREDDAFAMGGTAQLELYDPQPYPADDRTEFLNADGERCTLESGTEWPHLLPGDETWPAGSFKNAGNLTLTASSAPGPVVYEYFDSYYLRLAPDPVQQGSFTHNSFFSPAYIPAGASASVDASGGADIGAFSVTGLTLAADYVVTSPNLVTGDDIIRNDEALSFAWNPPAPGDKMAVIVKDSFRFIKCVFDDDGEGTVPAPAMAALNGQFVRYTIQTWREHSETQRVESVDGEQVDVKFTSRNVQIGRFDSP